MKDLFAALLLGAIIAAPTWAGAQTEGKAAEAEATEEAKAPDKKLLARDAFLKARAAFKAQRYQDALDGFQAAYENDPRPEMLYNIGLCQHKLGQLPAARDTYRRFLEEKPNSKARPKVEKKIAEIDATLKEPYEQDPADKPTTDQGSQPTPPPPPSEPYNRSGLSLYASVGVGALTSDLKDKYGSTYLDYSPSAGIGVGVMHRPLDFLAYGLRLTWAAQGVSASAGTAASAFFFEAAGLVEFYPLGLFAKGTRFDPFIGLGIGYGQVGVDLVIDRWDLRGATIHISTGMHIFVNRWIAVGAVLSYKAGIWTSACDSNSCLSIDELDADIADSLPGLFFIGAEGSFHFL